jgi:acyl transferase domain-containing protein
VYLGTEDKFYGAECDLADALSAQFTRKLDFAAILRKLYESGYSRFIECGAGDMLTGIASKALNGRAGLICRASAHPDTGVAAGSAAIFKEFERGLPAQAVDSVPELIQDVQAVLKRTSQVLEKVAVPRVAPVLRLQPAVEAKPQPEAVACPTSRSRSSPWAAFYPERAIRKNIGITF